jgi:hypothetical protein
MTLVNRFSAGLFISVAVIAASLALGVAAGVGYLSFQVFLGILFGGIVLIILAAGENSLRVGMAVWVLFFAIGYRTVQVSTYFRLHPLVVLIYLLGALYLTQRRTPEANHTSASLYFQLVMLVGLFFWLNGWVQGFLRGRRWDLMIGEALNILAIVPIFALVRHISEKPLGLRRLLQLFYGVGVFIAAIGIFEYFFTDFARTTLAGIVQTDNFVYLADAVGFLRASFVIWGSPAATFVCLLALPIILPYLTWTKGLAKVYVLIGAICLLVGIYIGGYRSLWMLSGILVMVALLSRRNPIVMTFGAGLAALAISLVPQAGQERLALAVETIQGTAYDNSIRTREEWFNFALTTGLTYPTGVGWGGTGWSHSDLAQVTGNLGVAAGVAFVTWYLVTLWRVWRAQQLHLTDPLILALLCSFIGVGGLLLFQGVQVLPQLAMPCWFIWAVAHVYAKQLRTSQRAI